MATDATFPQDFLNFDFSALQWERLALLPALYADWNAKINVISRRDIDYVMTHHVLHSLAIARFMSVSEGTRILDLGCGGGFPGIPLAIAWPHAHFHLIDRVGKKIKVAEAVAEAVGLTNVTVQHGDALECHSKFDYVVSRAVMTLPDLVKLSARFIAPLHRNILPPGLVCLKGGDLADELAATHRTVLDVPLTDWFADPFFETKRLIYCKL